MNIYQTNHIIGKYPSQLILLEGMNGAGFRSLATAAWAFATARQVRGTSGGYHSSAIGPAEIHQEVIRWKLKTWQCFRNNQLFQSIQYGWPSDFEGSKQVWLGKLQFCTCEICRTNMDNYQPGLITPGWNNIRFKHHWGYSQKPNRTFKFFCGKLENLRFLPGICPWILLKLDRLTRCWASWQSVLVSRTGR